jgi:hypothetical protein
MLAMPDSSPRATDAHAPRLGRPIALVAVFVVVGVPLVAYLWETANRLLAGRVEPVRLLVSAVVTALFVVVLRLLARRVDALEREHAAEIRALSSSNPSDRSTSP